MDQRRPQIIVGIRIWIRRIVEEQEGRRPNSSVAPIPINPLTHDPLPKRPKGAREARKHEGAVVVEPRALHFSLQNHTHLTLLPLPLAQERRPGRVLEDLRTHNPSTPFTRKQVFQETHFTHTLPSLSRTLEIVLRADLLGDRHSLLTVRIRWSVKRSSGVRVEGVKKSRS